MTSTQRVVNTLPVHNHPSYGVAATSRLLKIIGLFCKRDLEKRRYSAKETYNFKEPTNRSPPIVPCIHGRHHPPPPSHHFAPLLPKPANPPANLYRNAPRQLSLHSEALNPRIYAPTRIHIHTHTETKTKTYKYTFTYAYTYTHTHTGQSHMSTQRQQKAAKGSNGGTHTYTHTTHASHK